MVRDFSGKGYWVLADCSLIQPLASCSDWNEYISPGGATCVVARGRW